MTKDKEGKRTIKIKLPNLNLWMLATGILVILFLVMILQPDLLCTTGQASAASLTSEQAGEKALQYINDNLVQTGEATLVSSEDVSDVYKVTTSYLESEIDVYVTKDGRWLFLNSMPIDMDEPVTTTTTQPVKTCDDIAKSSNPIMEAFVVSYCPYGLQMQRIMAEIVDNIPELEDNIKIRYIGEVVNGEVTAMHGEEEATENLRQICIREEQGDKYWDYVSCFMKEQDSTESCLDEAGINENALDDCMGDTDRGVEYAQEDFDIQDQYEVTGSPTLIMNDEKVSEFDFGGRTAEAVKTLLCCGFSNQPSGCSQELSTSNAATSFSETYSGGSSAATGNC